MPVNIEQAFNTDNKSVYVFLSQPGIGLYVPLYQREYSWDKDNIEQLLEDLTSGVKRLSETAPSAADDDKEIRFLGTVIIVPEPNKMNIYPIDLQALPASTQKLIDGQQRLSTITLMGTLLAKRFFEIKKRIGNSLPHRDDMIEICDLWTKKLLSIYSWDLGRGTPTLKPKIIRGAKDYWTRADSIDVAYRSELSNYLARFIAAQLNGESSLPSIAEGGDGQSRLAQNSKAIESWLKRVNPTCEEDFFASPEKIVTNVLQDFLWDYERQDIADIIKAKDYGRKTNESYILGELAQLSAICHYLLDRCCFTIIQPTNDDWAFDMFQSLNATGTPLTAIETFKPAVVNTVNEQPGMRFKDSDSDKYFKKIEDFLSETTTAQGKNRRTNDYLTSFFTSYDGNSISTHFSYQRKVLNRAYEDQSSFSDKEKLVRRMGNYAQFYKAWIDYDGKDNLLFPLIDSSKEAELASLLLLFLKSSNHKMAITLLGTLYNNVIEQNDNAVEEFIKSLKAIVAYYFLWRSTSSNSGLDSTYRDFFKSRPEVSFNNIVDHFKQELGKKELTTKDQWINKAKDYCKYDTVKEVVKFALFVTAHDTIPDSENPGLMKIGRMNSHPYLLLQKWLSDELRTIEHIAPQTNEGAWDNALYDTLSKPFQSLGNLTLLPQDLNSSVGNKGWKEKLLYYMSVGEDDMEKLESIGNIAEQNGIKLNVETQQLLIETGYNEHLLPICTLSVSDEWNKDLVEKRTLRMLDIVWERLSPWLLLNGPEATN